LLKPHVADVMLPSLNDNRLGTEIFGKLLEPRVASPCSGPSIAISRYHDIAFFHSELMRGADLIVTSNSAHRLCKCTMIHEVWCDDWAFLRPRDKIARPWHIAAGHAQTSLSRWY
jgi:hypothetical protein